MPRTPRLDSLTALRFFAAALVLGHHAAAFLAPTGLLYAAVRTGYVGVGFFFVLSGFVLTWAHDERLPIRNFWGRRVARIAPLHLLTAALAVPVLLVLGRVIEPVPSALNILLLQAWVPIEQYGSSLNGVSWSLSCEAFFYLCFPLLVRWALRQHLGAAALLVSGLLVLSTALVVMLLPTEIAQLVTYKMPLFRIGEFVLGTLVAIALRRGARVPTGLTGAALALGASYAAASVLVSALGHTDLPLLRVFPDLIMIPATCLLIAAAAQSDLQQRPNLLRNRTLVRLGEASFALYMVHYLLIELWARLFAPTGAIAQVSQVVVVCVIAILLSLLAYRCVEHPAERRIRRWIGAPADRAASMGAAPTA